MMPAPARIGAPPQLAEVADRYADADADAATDAATTADAADPQDLRPLCPVACRILDEVRVRLDWQRRQRSRATCPPRVRYPDS